AGDPADGPALRGARPRLLAAHHLDGPLQLLLHALPDAALPVLRRLLPARGAALGRLALGRRGAAAAPSSAPDAPRVPRRGRGRARLGRALRCGALGAPARARRAHDAAAPRELEARPETESRVSLSHPESDRRRAAGFGV